MVGGGKEARHLLQTAEGWEPTKGGCQSHNWSRQEKKEAAALRAPAGRC